MTTITRVPGDVYRRAYLAALQRGEFADPCIHAEELPLCPEPDCKRLYESIIGTYCERLMREVM